MRAYFRARVRDFLCQHFGHRTVQLVRYGTAPFWYKCVRCGCILTEGDK